MEEVTADAECDGRRGERVNTGHDHPVHRERPARDAGRLVRRLMDVIG
jgi:hypothetical protein